MNLQLLNQKLRTFKECDLLALHRELVEICTGRPMPDYPVVNRHLYILETTDSVRGGLIDPLIGTMKGLDPAWVPANRADRLHLNTCLTFESKPEAGQPEFHIQHQGEERIRVEEHEALAHVRHATAQPAHVHIAGCLERLPARWSVTLCPPVTPDVEVKQWLEKWDKDAYWLLCCKNQESGILILMGLEDFPYLATPLLANVSEPANDADRGKMPHFLCHVPFLHRVEEVVAMISCFFERVARIEKPDVEALIYSILLSHQNATGIQKQAQERKLAHASSESLVKKAALDWELLFLNERREAIRDLQLESVAHMMTKFKLLTRNARQARVAIYAQDQLRPRIRNFLKRVVLEMAAHSPVAGYPAEKSHDSMEMRKKFENSAMLKAGIFHALPSLALLIPVSIVNGAEAKQATEQLVATAAVSMSGGWIDRLRDKILEPLTDRLDKTNELLEELVGVLVATTAGMAIGAAIAGVAASYVVVRGSIVLYETEQMIRDLIDETERAWPGVEDSLRALLPALVGDLDEKTIENAGRVIHHIENYQPCR